MLSAGDGANLGRRVRVLYLQRMYGVEGLLSYPLSTFAASMRAES